jgi:hypothetical protein
MANSEDEFWSRLADILGSPFNQKKTLGDLVLISDLGIDQGKFSDYRFRDVVVVFQLDRNLVGMPIENFVDWYLNQYWQTTPQLASGLGLITKENLLANGGRIHTSEDFSCLREFLLDSHSSLTTVERTRNVVET